MAASKSMLESLLARVRQRATEPRGNRPPLPQQAPANNVVATSPPPAARAVAAVALEEEVEEYDDELIEILDDDEVASESSPPSEPESAEPLELRASAPSVEMRRRAVPPSSRPNPIAARPGAPAPAAAQGSAAAALRAEVVARRPTPATAVVQARESRPDPRSQSFLQLLDASLDLGE